MAHMSTHLTSNHDNQSSISGLTRKLHDNEVVAADQSSGHECSICYSSTFENRAIVQPCHHEFCLECVRTWIAETKDTCPNCRAIMTEIHHSYDHQGRHESEIVHPVVPVELDPHGWAREQRRRRRAAQERARLRALEEERVIAAVTDRVERIREEILNHSPNRRTPELILEDLGRANQQLREEGVTRYENGNVRTIATKIDMCISFTLGTKLQQSRLLTPEQQRLLETQSIIPRAQPPQRIGSSVSFAHTMRFQFARVADQQTLLNTMQVNINAIRRNLLQLDFHPHPSNARNRRLIAEELRGIVRELNQHGIARLEGGLTTRHIWAEIDDLLRISSAEFRP